MINNEKVPRDELKIRGLTLERNGIKINLDLLQSKLCHINAQSLLSINQHLKVINFLSLHSPDIVFIIETWLKPEVTDPEIFSMNSPYSVIAQKDRTSGEHGGVLIATKNSFALNYSILSYDADYCIGLSIYSGAFNHIFLLIYNPPLRRSFGYLPKCLVIQYVILTPN